MLTRLALIVSGSLTLQVVLVALLAAWRRSGNIYVKIIAVSLATAPIAAVAGTMWFGPALGRDGTLFLVLIHLALGGFFFHFTTLPDRSVTLRILVELLLAPGQTLSADALGRRYGVSAMITSRLTQLSAANFIEIMPDQRIRLCTRGRWFGRFVTAGRQLFAIDSAN
jgi:hypothetical protein